MFFISKNVLSEIEESQKNSEEIENLKKIYNEVYSKTVSNYQFKKICTKDSVIKYNNLSEDIVNDNDVQEIVNALREFERTLKKLKKMEESQGTLEFMIHKMESHNFCSINEKMRLFEALKGIENELKKISYNNSENKMTENDNISKLSKKIYTLEWFKCYPEYFC